MLAIGNLGPQDPQTLLCLWRAPGVKLQSRGAQVPGKLGLGVGPRVQQGPGRALKPMLGAGDYFVAKIERRLCWWLSWLRLSVT